MEDLKADIFKQIMAGKRAHWNLVWLNKIIDGRFSQYHGTIKYRKGGRLIWELIPGHPYTDIIEEEDTPYDVMQALDYGLRGCHMVVAWDKSM